MATLPNPFLGFTASSDAVEEAVATTPPSSPVAAADRFVLDDDAFLAELDPPPLFLQQRFPDLRAEELIDVLKVLARY